MEIYSITSNDHPRKKTLWCAEVRTISFQSYRSTLIGSNMDVLNRQRACEQLFLLSPLNSDTSPFFVNRKMIWYRKWVGARRCQHWRKYHLLTSYFRFYWMLFLKTHQLSLRSIERFYIFCFQLNIDCLFLVFWSWRFNIFFTIRKVQIIPFFFFK